MRRLDHDPDADTRVGMPVEQALADGLQHLRGRDLGHQDHVGARRRRGREIVGEPRRVEAVDAHEHLAAAEAAGLDGLGDQPACLGLGVGRDRVLEVEDDGVDRQGLGLLHGAGVRSRHVEHAAARANRHVLSPEWRGLARPSRRRATARP